LIDDQLAVFQARFGKYLPDPFEDLVVWCAGRESLQVPNRVFMSISRSSRNVHLGALLYNGKAGKLSGPAEVEPDKVRHLVSGIVYHDSVLALP
jgi:hypothetical protein